MTTGRQVTARLRRHVHRPHAPFAAHLIVLAAGFVVYAIIATREWFFYDDWYFLTQQQDVVWSPHVGHWSTVGALVFLALQRVFGMDHYLPFAIPAILVHLGAVALTWRIMVRAAVRPWIATAFSVLLVFLGAGAEAIDWAVQIGFVGAITAVLGAILILDGPRLTARRGAAAAILLLLSLAASEVALPFIVVALVLSWLRHGPRRTATVFSGPLIAFLIWFLLEGRLAPTAGRATGLTQLLAVPQYAVTMLSDGVGRMFPLAVLGGLVFVALGVWWMFTVKSAPRTATAAYLLFLAAPLFALLTGFARVANGPATATSTRYVYVVVIAIAPLLAICVDRATRQTSLVPVLALILLIAAWNVGGVALALTTRIDRAQSTRVEVAQTAAVISAHPNCLAATSRPSPQWAPDVTVADIRHWMAEGWYHPAKTSPESGTCTTP